MGNAEVDRTVNIFTRFKDKNGGMDGIVAPIYLPIYAMKRFEIELENLLMTDNQRTFIKSSL